MLTLSARRFGLGTPANDIAMQLPALIAGNEWETISSLLIGLSPSELQAVSDRAIALYDVPPETVRAIFDTLGKTEVIEIVDSKPAAALNILKAKGRTIPLWAWVLGAAALAGTGVLIYKRRRR